MKDCPRVLEPLPKEKACSCRCSVGGVDMAWVYCCCW